VSQLRETIDRHRGTAVAVCIGVIVLASGYTAYSTRRPSLRVVGLQNKAFYSNDDGKTWFIDDVDKPVPFDHKGAKAVIAHIFRCGDGKPFVVYLESHDSAAKPDDSTRGTSLDSSIEVKKPGQDRWFSPNPNVSRKDSPYFQAMILTCPDGQSGPEQAVFPTDSDNGASD
jgi:hypothetical protein